MNHTMKTLTTKWTRTGILLGGCLMFAATVGEAVVGAPLSPVSVGGVARRTTRRAVVATSAATPAPAPAPAPAAAPAPTTVVVVTAPAPAPAPAAGPAVGTVVTSLPPGSQSVGDDFVCNNVYYRPTIQGSKLVYEVVAH